MENRSFDDLFNGFPGADTVRSGFDHFGNVVPLAEAPLYEASDISHSHKSAVQDIDGGKMDGFDLSRYVQNGPTPVPTHYPYQYTQPSDVVPYWSIAARYVVADRMFQTNTGPSMPAHFYLTAGQSPASENPIPGKGYPWGCDSGPLARAAYIDPNTGKEVWPGLFPCYDLPTLPDEMDAANVTWRYYAPNPFNMTAQSKWLVLDAVRHIRYGVDWTNGDIADTSRFVKDVAGGTLPAVAWVIPPGVDSGHAGGGFTVDQGPQWLASIVDAVGQSAYWNSSAILIVWDDWGGWYDHVPPPQLDYYGLGMRVPLLVVSPYAKQGYVSHVQHEFGSLLRFTETVFGLPTMTAEDARSDSLADCFQFDQAPRPFATIAPQGVVRAFPGFDPPDDE